MRIGITGVTRTGNIGGVMMLLTTIQQITGHLPDANFRLFSIAPAEDLAAEPIENLEIVPTPYRKLILIYAPLSFLLRPIIRTKFIQKLFFSKSHYFKSLITTDVIIDLSGIAFVDGRGLGLLAYNTSVCLPSLMLGKPVYKLSQALGPFNGVINKIFSRFTLSRCRKVIARGSKSFSYLKSLGLNNILELPDTAFAFRISNFESQKAEKILQTVGGTGRPVIVSPSEVANRLCSQKGISFEEIIKEFIRKLRKVGKSVLLLPHSFSRDRKSKNNDVLLSQSIYDSFIDDQSVHLLVLEQQPELMRAVIGCAESVVACRFHATVNSLSMGVPVLVIGWSHKYEEMLSDFYQDNQWILSYDSLSLNELFKRYVELDSMLSEVKQKIKDSYKDVSNKSRENYLTLLEDYKKYLIQKTKNQNPIVSVVKNDLCIGCGYCTVTQTESGATSKIKMCYNSKTDSYTPDINSDSISTIDETKLVCPGKKMSMPEISQLVYGSQPKDPILGQVISIRLGESTDELVREKAASGGIIPAILTHLFDENLVDVVYCATPGSSVNLAVGQIIRSKKQVDSIHGSIYHPVNYGVSLEALLNGTERFAFVGLPCEVASFAQLKSLKPDLAKRHVVSLGLFCGGINTFKGIAYYLKGFGIDWKNVKNLNYRHGYWPGKIKVDLKDGGTEKIVPRIRENTRWKILRYIIGFQGYWMLKRCRLCPDQISDFADIAVGDPHLPELRREKSFGYSVVLTRTSFGEQLIQDCIKKQKIAARELSRNDVIESQGYTLDNRRHVIAYQRVARFLRMKTPDIEVYPELNDTIRFRHYVYACVDLIKIALPKWKILQLFYIPWQIFEYLFLTFTPHLILKKISKLITNK